MPSLNLTKEVVPEKVQAFFREHPRVALAYSGGCDSAFLLACARACGAEAKPYLVHSAFQYNFEPRDARLIARALGVEFELIEVDIFQHEEVVSNPWDRCYFCKRVIFSTILERAKQDGFEVLIDGTNATDNPDRRPGFRALAELGVISPLRLAGLTKDEIRSLSREMGLITSDKPNYSCLATRIEPEVRITEDALQVFEQQDWLEL